MGMSRKMKSCVKRHMKGRGKISTRRKRAARACKKYRKKK